MLHFVASSLHNLMSALQHLEAPVHEAGGRRLAPRLIAMEMQEMASKTKRTRNPNETRARILAAAKTEFAEKGLAGARVDGIAQLAKANKRMIYHYFGLKEELFQKVLEDAYLAIREAEQSLALDCHSPPAALERLVRFTWDYYLKNPEFLMLVNNENLLKASHLKKSERIRPASRRFVDMVQELLDRGVAAGDFRPGVDAVQLNITIAAIGYYYLTNRHTGAILFERNLMSPEALEERLAFNVETVLRLVRAEQ